MVQSFLLSNSHRLLFNDRWLYKFFNRCERFIRYKCCISLKTTSVWSHKDRVVVSAPISVDKYDICISNAITKSDIQSSWNHETWRIRTKKDFLLTFTSRSKDLRMWLHDMQEYHIRLNCRTYGDTGSCWEIRQSGMTVVFILTSSAGLRRTLHMPTFRLPYGLISPNTGMYITYGERTLLVFDN